jgi:hypothetical protein
MPRGRMKRRASDCLNEDACFRVWGGLLLRVIALLSVAEKK